MYRTSQVLLFNEQRTTNRFIFKYFHGAVTSKKTEFIAGAEGLKAVSEFCRRFLKNLSYFDTKYSITNADDYAFMDASGLTM